MSNNIAIAFVHGIGTQDKNYADGFMGEVIKACSKRCAATVWPRAIHWAEALQVKEDLLWERLLKKAEDDLDLMRLRRLMVDFVADALAYQVIRENDRNVYDEVHKLVAIGLRKLAQEAGGNSPLIIIAHSLGTVITSNYIYDLQYHGTEKIVKDKDTGEERTVIRDLISPAVQQEISQTPLENCQTLTRLYTLGSPLALWGLRYTNLGRPIRLKSPPDAYATRYRDLLSRWINVFDKQDVIGYPLKPLNADYDAAVYADLEINVGEPGINRTPLAHMAYSRSQDIIDLITDGVVETWQALNG